MAARTPALRLNVAAVACSRYRKTRYIDTLACFCSHNARAKDPSACTSNHIARCTDEHKEQFASVAVMFMCGTSTACRQDSQHLIVIWRRSCAPSNEAVPRRLIRPLLWIFHGRKLKLMHVPPAPISG
jgi:hypothetical protein